MQPSNRGLSKRIKVLAVVALLLIGSVAAVVAYQRLSAPPTCADPLGGSKVLRTQLAPPKTFGGVTEFALPEPLRAPNAPYVAPDGSVWFAEQSVAGIAHLYPGNGTLVEYAWPYNYPAPPFPDGVCGNKSSTWGLVLWDGKVWAADTSGNQLVALDPSTGQFSAVKIPTNYSYPYTLTPGPGNTLWFTELFGARIGELFANGTIREYALPGGSSAVPGQIVFANSTTGFYDDIGNSTSANGGVYSFDVDHFAPVLLGGQKLFEPTSLALASGALWVALHGSSSVGSYNFTTRSWSYLPTSSILWDGSPVTTLPYFVDANGSEVWVTEHYGNRMALIDPQTDSLTEYSESPHQVDGNDIVSALTLSVGAGKVWFAEWGANGMGYVDPTYDPGFFTTIQGNTTVVVDRGSSATVQLAVRSTTSQGTLNLTFSDSESPLSTPENLTFSADPSLVTPQPGGETLVTVTVTALDSVKPGTYWAILSATDGLTYESSFLKIVVPA